MIKFSQQKNTSQIFKVHLIELFDRITNLNKYALQLNRISGEENDQACDFEAVLSRKSTFITDCYKIFTLREVASFQNVTEVMLNIIQEYENVIEVFQEMQAEQKLILSKISVNKEIFQRCKVLFIKMQRYFFNCSSIIPAIKKFRN